MRRLPDRKLWWLLGTGIFCVLLVALSYFVFFRPPSTVSIFKEADLSTFDFPVYYPTQLPQDYHLQPGSIGSPSDTKAVLTYVILGPKKEKIYVSEQSRINTFDYGGFFKRIVQAKTAVSPIGQIGYGYTGTDLATSIASVVTAKTWVIVNSSASTVTPEVLHQIVVRLSILH